MSTTHRSPSITAIQSQARKWLKGLLSSEAILRPVFVHKFEVVRSQDRSPKGGTVLGETEPLQTVPRSGNGGEQS